MNQNGEKKDEKKLQEQKKNYLKNQLAEKANYDAFKRLTEK